MLKKLHTTDSSIYTSSFRGGLKEAACRSKAAPEGERRLVSFSLLLLKMSSDRLAAHFIACSCSCCDSPTRESRLIQTVVLILMQLLIYKLHTTSLKPTETSPWKDLMLLSCWNNFTDPFSLVESISLRLLLLLTVSMLKGEDDLQDPSAHQPDLLCLRNICSESDTDLLSGRGERHHHTGMDVYNQT
ncbi:uncharacterized protein LOC122974236 isoform X12 [Thunnus albacares]|uniref:uncharacterized protein LOC122974236 isoform X12 n=1 Tax=Thunnus albacares TaxID=8236 RepID=UPI001CF6ADD3|nr:uncharacterized protein LOC122974236 isoform X12 [Thunnus albacares]